MAHKKAGSCLLFQISRLSASVRPVALFDQWRFLHDHRSKFETAILLGVRRRPAGAIPIRSVRQPKSKSRIAGMKSLEGDRVTNLSDRFHYNFARAIAHTLAHDEAFDGVLEVNGEWPDEHRGDKAAKLPNLLLACLSGSSP